MEETDCVRRANQRRNLGCICIWSGAASAHPRAYCKLFPFSTERGASPSRGGRHYNTAAGSRTHSARVSQHNEILCHTTIQERIAFGKYAQEPDLQTPCVLSMQVTDPHRVSKIRSTYRRAVTMNEQETPADIRCSIPYERPELLFA